MKILNILILLLISSSIISRKSKKVSKKVKAKSENYFVLSLENSGKISSVKAENTIDKHTTQTLLGSNPAGWEFKLTEQIPADLAKFLIKSNDKYYIPYKLMNYPIAYDYIGNREFKFIRFKVYDTTTNLSYNFSVRLPYGTWGYFVDKEVGEDAAKVLKSKVDSIATYIKSTKSKSKTYGDSYLSELETMNAFNDRTARINTLNEENKSKASQKDTLIQNAQNIRANVENLENQLIAEKAKYDETTNKISELENSIQINLNQIKELEDVKTDISAVEKNLKNNKSAFEMEINKLIPYSDNTLITNAKNPILSAQSNFKKDQLLQSMDTQLNTIFYAPK
jgi:hypothetical protein